MGGLPIGLAARFCVSGVQNSSRRSGGKYTNARLADGTAIYQQQIPNLGWTLTAEPAIPDNTGLLSPTQGDQDMTHNVDVVDTGAIVRVVLGKPQDWFQIC